MRLSESCLYNKGVLNVLIKPKHICHVRDFSLDLNFWHFLCSTCYLNRSVSAAELYD